MGHVVKIGRYEIVDADLDSANPDTFSIPCHTNPSLVTQLDGWDRDTSIPGMDRWGTGEFAK